MKKILLASSLALFFVACGTEKTTTKEVVKPALTLNTPTEVPAGYQIKPLEVSNFKVHTSGGKHYVTVLSGAAVLEKAK